MDRNNVIDENVSVHPALKETTTDTAPLQEVGTTDAGVSINAVLAEGSTVVPIVAEEDASLSGVPHRTAEEISMAKELRTATRRKRRFRSLSIVIVLFLSLIGIGYFAVMAIGSADVINHFSVEGDATELSPMYVFIGEDVEILFPIYNNSNQTQTLRADFGQNGSSSIEMAPQTVTAVPLSLFNIKESTEVVLTYAKGKTLSCKVVAIEPSQIVLDSQSVRVKKMGSEETNPVTTPYICQPGEVNIVSFLVKNESGLEYKREIVPNVNGEEKETLVAFFETGQREILLTFEFLCEAEGTYNITLDDISFPLLCYANNDNKLGNTRLVMINTIEKKGSNFLFTVENKTSKGFFLHLTNQEQTQTVFKLYMPPSQKAELANLADGVYYAYVCFGEYYNSTIKGYVLPGTTFKFTEPYTFINTEDRWNKIVMTITGEAGTGTAAGTEGIDSSVIPPPPV